MKNVERYRPSLEEAQKLAGQYATIPISREIYSDATTPIEVLRVLKGVGKRCFILESLEDRARWGRYTFLGYEPKMEVSCKNGVVTIDAGAKISVSSVAPSDILRQILADNKSPRFDYLPPYAGGLVGYFSYDYVQYAEPAIKLKAEDVDNFQDFDLALFDKAIAFDSFRQKIVVIVNVKTDELEENYRRGVREIEQTIDLILNGEKASISPLKLRGEMKPTFDEKRYCEMVCKAKEHIREGDVFQIVLSNGLATRAEGSLFDAYRVLRTTNPSPYMFYLSGNEFELAGASPETLVKLVDGSVFTYPLAGTRPRGDDEAENERLEEELLADPKELAEHNMLVDLGRNDLGKISKFGTIKVSKYKRLERFSRVVHIGSEVVGEIRDDKQALDALEAVLPAGTLSGAPKIRACQLIDELENDKRGAYGGAIGYFDFAGNMDFCIGIRLAVKKNDRVFVRSGAGIVADSVPKNEYKECAAKVYAVKNALEIANGGLDDSFNR